MNENSLVKDIGRSYIFSSMLPAGIFVALGVFIYRDFVFSNYILEAGIDNLSTGLVIFLLLSAIMWIGFALYSSVNWTVRLYEGYYLPELVRKILVYLFYRCPHRKKTQNIKKILQAKSQHTAESEEIIKKYYDQAWAEYGDVELSGPIREEDLLPSMLGNVLRASEQYPTKYGLTAGVNMWTRLAVLLPPEMATVLEEKNNNILFLLNSSLLAYLHCLFALVISGLHYYMGVKAPVEKYLIIAGSCFVVGYALYLLSIPVAKTLGLLVRSSFDLYRFDLLKQLNYSIPTSLSQEQKLWLKISDFIVTAGNLGRQPLEFEYNLQSKYMPEKMKGSHSLIKATKKKRN